MSSSMGDSFTTTSSLQEFLFLRHMQCSFSAKPTNNFLKGPTIVGFSLIVEGNLQGDYLNTKLRDRAIGKQREIKTGTETQKQLGSLWWFKDELAQGLCTGVGPGSSFVSDPGNNYRAGCQAVLKDPAISLIPDAPAYQQAAISQSSCMSNFRFCTETWSYSL